MAKLCIKGKLFKKTGRVTHKLQSATIPVEDEEGLELYLEDLEAEMEDGVEGAEEDAGEL